MYTSEPSVGPRSRHVNAAKMHVGSAFVQPKEASPQMRVALLSREYPPEVYGGAGVHVIGGADVAAELDAKRAIAQGTRLAATL